jgi:hypothetical protein
VSLCCAPLHCFIIITTNTVINETKNPVLSSQYFIIFQLRKQKKEQEEDPIKANYLDFSKRMISLA